MSKKLNDFLKSKADEVVITDNKAQILAQVDYQPQEQKKKSIFDVFKWSLIPLGALGAAVVICLALLPNKDNPNNPPVVAHSKSYLGYEVLAVGSVLDNPNPQNVKTLKRLSDNDIDDDTDTDTENENTNYQGIASDIKNYLVVGEMMLAKKEVTTTVTDNEDSNYSYKYVLKTTYTDNSKNDNNYTMYFNENKVQESDDDIEEVSSTFNGLLIKNDVTYQISGEKEMEAGECELTMRVYYDDSKANYVMINQEIEHMENEYTYSYYQNNKLVEEVSLEIETQNNRKEMGIEIKKGMEETEYEFVYVSENKIECSYDNDSSEYELVINIGKDYYEFIFENNTTIKVSK